MQEPTVLSRLLSVLKWLDLGDSQSARQELRSIRPRWSDFPRIIKLKWCICAVDNEWHQALAWGRFLRQTVPQDASAWIQEAEALNALDRTQEAWEILLPASNIFGDEAAVPYLLACYSGRLGYVNGAKQWLRKAVEINPSIRMTFSVGNEPELRCVLVDSGSLLRGGWAGVEHS
jgi:tetratricopeptide (TPR) repeat protein